MVAWYVMFRVWRKQVRRVYSVVVRVLIALRFPKISSVFIRTFSKVRPVICPADSTAHRSGSCWCSMANVPIAGKWRMEADGVQCAVADADDGDGSVVAHSDAAADDSSAAVRVDVGRPDVDVAMRAKRSPLESFVSAADDADTADCWRWPTLLTCANFNV